MIDYVGLTYKDYPYTEYPAKLTRYLVDRYNIPPGARVLDVGCGRGEYVDGFSRWLCNAAGMDSSPYALERYPYMRLYQYFPDGEQFDVMFSKSFLEHQLYPVYFVKRMYENLVPGGLCIAMVPDYEECWRGFYGAVDHVHPFMLSALEELFEWVGFEKVECEKFLQSPPLWAHPWKRPFYKLATLWPGKKSKDIIFSGRKYTMLLCSGRKPD